MRKEDNFAQYTYIFTTHSANKHRSLSLTKNFYSLNDLTTSPQQRGGPSLVRRSLKFCATKNARVRHKKARARFSVAAT